MFLRRPINISSATAVVFFSLLVSPSWASLSPAPSVHAFVGVHKKHQRHVSATSRHLFLDPSISAAVDIRSLYTQETIESSKSNEWGIPASDTLVPLSNKGEPPKEKLDNGGRITLVGSGPGDPDLLTLKAYKLLQEPDTLVIVDRLVSKEIVDLIKGDVKVARKLPGCAELAQEEIYWWAHQGLAAGKHVIRLKIGDPFVFGRGGEEVLTFRRFGVESKVIPGVSSAFSAPLLGNIPVTHRGVSNQVVMCTGYGREGTSPDLIQYHEEQTIVFLMAVGRLRELCGRLIKMAGYPSDTPVGIIEKAGCPTQRTVVGDMTTIADIAEKYNIQAPSTIVVGKVVNVLLDKTDEGLTVQGLIQSAADEERVAA